MVFFGLGCGKAEGPFEPGPSSSTGTQESGVEDSAPKGLAVDPEVYLEIPGRRRLPASAYSLVDAWPFAVRRSEPLVIQPGTYRDRGYLLSGWSVPNEAEDPPSTSNEPVGCWADHVGPELLLPIREVGGRVLECTIVLHRNDKVEGPFQSVTRLNGHELEPVELKLPGENRVRLELPAEFQVLGDNVLTFDFPYAIAPRRLISGSQDARTLSGFLSDVRIGAVDAMVEARRIEAASLLPVGSLALSDAGVVEQMAGSHLAVYRAARGGDVLWGQCLTVDRGLGDSSSVRMRALLETDGNAPRVLFEGEPNSLDPIEFEIELGLTAGQPYRLRFEVERAGDHKTVSAGAWIDVRVEAEVSKAPRTESAGEELERVRESLANAPIVVLLVDAANPDFISTYGGRENLTPAIDQLIESGVSFQRAYSPATYTLAAIPSLMTSHYPWEHGAWSETTSLGTDWPTWAGEFAEAGYRTTAIVHSPNGSDRFGYLGGFEEVLESFDGFRPTAPDFPVPRVEDAIEPLREALASDDGRPPFVWVHIVEPHEPYFPPAPWRGSLDPDYEGELDGSHATLNKIQMRDVLPTERDLDHIRRAYEEGWSYLDHGMAQLLEVIEASPHGEEAIVVLVSDHGEAFLRHPGKSIAGMGHGFTAHEDMARIPLALRLPKGLGLEGVRREEPVNSIDLMPTLADLVGIQARIGTPTASSFAKLCVDESAPARPGTLTASYSRHAKRYLPDIAHWWDDYKAIVRVGDRSSVYAIFEDPLEQNDLAPEQPVLIGWMEQRVRELTGFDPKLGVVTTGSPQVELTGETRDMLKQLGYLDGQ